MADRLLTVLAIDPDPIFRAGLRACLGTRSRALAVVESISAAVTAGDGEPPDVILWDWTGSDRGDLETLVGPLRSRFGAAVAIVVISADGTVDDLAAARGANLAGFCRKPIAIADLLAAIEGAIAGAQRWDGATAQPKPEPEPRAAIARSVAPWRRNLFIPGVVRIEQSLQAVDQWLTLAELSRLDRAIAAGRRRELRMARRMVLWMAGGSAVPTGPVQTPSGTPPPGEPNRRPERPATASPTEGALVRAAIAAIDPMADAIADGPTLRAYVFERVGNLLTAESLENRSQRPLELEILSLDSRGRLLAVALTQTQDYFNALATAIAKGRVPDAQRPDAIAALMYDIWGATIEQFFGRYDTITWSGEPVVVAALLREEWPAIAPALRDRAVLFEALAGHLVAGQPLWIEGQTHEPGSLAAIVRTEALLQNWILRLANAVIQPLLNRLSDVEAIKYQFFQRRWLGTRELERFRNDLSWTYRRERYFDEPTAMFESRYHLLTVREAAIARSAIYAARNDELRTLRGIPLAVTLLLETRDALAPQVRGAVSWLGKGALYLLQAIGRALGLVGRGIAQGFGDSASASRFRRSVRSPRSS
jgi:DNA-binding NarL/FixJ family response regulator